MLWLYLLAALASEPLTCQTTSAYQVGITPAPAVIVLGERRGTKPDVPRAAQIVRSLAVEAPVTVALEAVSSSKQSILDFYNRDELSIGALPGALDWEQQRAGAFKVYAKLFRLAPLGVQWVAAGTGLDPDDTLDQVVVPPSYGALLADAAAGPQLVPQVQERLARTMAWADAQIAQTAIASWNGQGYLVVLVDRTRVEGGLGVGWQLQQLTDVPVHSVVLAWGTTPPCYPSDTLIK